MAAPSLGSWLASWFGSWFGASSAAPGPTTLDCEGLCCCRCHFFKTIGYYNKADVVIPSPTSYTGMPASSPAFRLSVVLGLGGTKSYTLQIETAAGSPFANTPPTYASEPLYGSEGGVGECRWSYWDYDATQDIVTYIVAFVSGSDFIIITQYYVFADMSYPFPTNVFEYWGNIPVTQPGAFTSTTLSNLAIGSGHVFYVPATDAEIAPSADATWYQCGENEDGTPYETVEGMRVGSPDPQGKSCSDKIADMVRAKAPNVRVNVRKPLPLAHPDRCLHLGKRTESRAGCNGWKCAHDCELGLKAVPGSACQTCEAYEVDPDYVGMGAPGWLS